ncbi:MAG TPA: hypothetical protein VE978_05320, partial [Chitinophagales bacterium]|nr:hypothetical protein [Chitinophagales bacterium]
MKNLLQQPNSSFTRHPATGGRSAALFLLIILTISFGKGYAQCTPQGNPSVYGDHVWNVYVYNSGGAVDTGQSWNYSYSGYYVETELSFSTESRWSAF